MNHPFRDSFKYVAGQAIQWFPGHMGKGLKQMYQTLKSVDCVIEVHDARIPFSGRNPEFCKVIGSAKPHILVLNKKDLGSYEERNRIRTQLREYEGIKHMIFTNCKNPKCEGTKKLISLSKDLIQSSCRYNREGKKKVCIMIVGVPNVGKSSLLNVLRNIHLHKKKATAIGPEAGVTRSILERIKICEDPPIYMVDTPGILEPRIRNDEMGLKLALVGCIKDGLVDVDAVADYLLYFLNKNKRFEYVEMLGLNEPSDNISLALVTYANKLGYSRRMRRYDGCLVDVPDTITAGTLFINEFRKGKLGLFNLDKF